MLTTREATVVPATTLGVGKNANAGRLAFERGRVYYQTMISPELLIIFAVFAFFMLMLFVGDYFGASPDLMVALSVLVLIFGYGIYSLINLFT